VREFLTSLGGQESRGRLRVKRTNFERSAPPLVHRVLDAET
jgi:hypothetical protein